MTKKNIIVIILIIGLVFFFWSSVLLQSSLQKAIVFLQNYGNLYPVLSIIIFVGLSALSTMLTFFSSVLLVPVAVVLWANPLTVSFLLFGWLIGAIFSYLIGRCGGYPLVQKFAPIKRVEYYHRLVAERLGFWIIFLFRLTLPSEIPGYLLGIVRYSFAKYLLITFLAEMPYAIYVVYAIDSIIDKKPIIFAIIAVTWLLIAWLLIYLYRKKILKMPPL